MLRGGTKCYPEGGEGWQGVVYVLPRTRTHTDMHVWHMLIAAVAMARICMCLVSAAALAPLHRQKVGV